MSERVVPVQIPVFLEYTKPMDVPRFPVKYIYKDITSKQEVLVLPDVLDRMNFCLEPWRGMEGGILGMTQGMVTHFYHDEKEEKNIFYQPHSRKLQAEVERWAAEGICFAGVVVGHLLDVNWPGNYEQSMIRDLLACNPQLESVLLCIVAERKLYFYRFDQDFLLYWVPQIPALAS